MNISLLRLHNLRVVQSRKGWTNANAMQAVADARDGIVYEPEQFARVEAANAELLAKVPPYETRKGLRVATLAVGRDAS